MLTLECIQAQAVTSSQHMGHIKEIAGKLKIFFFFEKYAVTNIFVERVGVHKQFPVD